MRGRPANLGRRVRVATKIDLADIQGNVLRGYTFPVAAYLFLRIDDVERGRALLRRMLPEVTTARPWEDEGAVDRDAGRVHLRRPGLARPAGRAAGLVPGRVPRGHGRTGRAPRRSRRERARQLGAGPGDRRDARAGHRLRGRPRASRRRAASCCAAWAPRRARPPSSTRQRAEVLAGGRDHFGFYDGIAQPAVAGSGVAARPGDGQPDGAGRWRDVATGEFLLGHADEDGDLPAAPPPPLDRNGTFMVYRKLAMDVAALPVASWSPQGAATPAGRRCSRPRSSGAGATARRWRSPRTRPTRRSRATRRASTTSRSPATTRACAARSARTSAAPTRATPRASSTAA